MFGWLKRRRRDKNRSIFEYFDGTRDRVIDPLVAYRGLETHPVFRWDTHFPDAIEGEDWDAQEATSQAVRDVFGVKSLEDGGLTITECIGLMMAFSAYCNAVKKKYNPLPISAEPTEPPPPENSPTSTSSDSGSTSAASTPDDPASSCEG